MAWASRPVAAGLPLMLTIIGLVAAAAVPDAVRAVEDVVAGLAARPVSREG